MLWVRECISAEVACALLLLEGAQRSQPNRAALGYLVEQGEDAPGDFWQQVPLAVCYSLC